MKSIDVLVRDTAANLNMATQTIPWTHRAICIHNSSYAYHPEVSSWNPVNLFAPTYAGALSIACKLVPADRVVQQLNLSASYTQNATCADINKVAFSKAHELLKEHWPASIARFEKQGRGVDYMKDKSVTIGPEWVFLSDVDFRKNLKMLSLHRLYSTRALHPKFTLAIFYRKVVSPAKAVEFLQTTSLTKRY